MSAEILLRKLEAKDEAQHASLLDRCFAVPPGHHYLDDFPIWSREHEPSSKQVLKMGAFQGDQLVGSACVQISEVKAPVAPLRVGLIGAVVTDEKFRGKGIAPKAVALAVEWAKNQGASLAVLWGSEHELYGKLGFVACGRQVRVPLNAMHSSSGTQKIKTGWNPAIFSILKQRKSGLRLDDSDRKWFEAHKNVEWYWTGPDQAPTAYAGLGRGIDLSNLVHEWGGESKALIGLLSEISNTHALAQILGSPETFGQIGIQFDPSAIECLCLARIIDPLALFRSYVTTEKAPKFSADFKNDSWQLEVQDRFGKASRIRVDATDMARFIFGPKSADASNSTKPWSNFFPLPLWFWGLDAV